MLQSFNQIYNKILKKTRNN